MQTLMADVIFSCTQNIQHISFYMQTLMADETFSLYTQNIQYCFLQIKYLYNSFYIITQTLLAEAMLLFTQNIP